jgi:predicted metal-dependent TIM-barrel fold hydrolase
MDRIIDSHVHLRLLYKYNPERIDWLIAHRCTVISWAFGGNISCGSADLNRYLRDRLTVFKELRGRGLQCYHLCGIHPRKIPSDLKPEAVEEILTPFLDDPHCLGIGEIGLETGSSREEEILCAQVECGLSLNRPDIRFGIHTPRQKKAAITGRSLSLLAAYPALAPVAVIDHCSQETIGPVLAGGYHAGISLSSTKSTEGELIQMVTTFQNESHRIMCNTDSSREFYEDLVPAAGGGALERSVAENLFFRSASRFFGLGTAER